MNREIDVLVVGAGISGLTAAWWLHRAGTSISVLEKEVWAGGTMRTDREGEWLVETGPNSALETTPLFGEMFDALGITGERLYANPAGDNRYILRNGVLHPLPMSPAAFLRSSLWSPGGKLRLLQEPFVGKADTEETIAEFVTRRLGQEFLDYAINPFVAGVYAGNPESLSVRAAFPKLYALEEKYGGLIKGMIKGRKERRLRAEKAKDRAKMFSFAAGMQVFPNAIARALGDRVQLGWEVTSISRPDENESGTERRFQVVASRDGKTTKWQAKSVILATPAYVASTFIRPFAPGLGSKLDAVYYPPVAEVFLGFDSDQCLRPLDGFGYLIPAKEKREILGTIWSSVLFPNRAPANHVALTTFVGGSRQPEMAEVEDKELLKIVLREIQSIMNVRGQPVFSRIARWTKAIPQYHRGYFELYREIDDLESSQPGLFLCGNYRGGIAVGDCVMNGKKTADNVLAMLAHARANVGQERARSHSG